jgi:hypothetical protein
MERVRGTAVQGHPRGFASSKLPKPVGSISILFRAKLKTPATLSSPSAKLPLNVDKELKMYREQKMLTQLRKKWGRSYVVEDIEQLGTLRVLTSQHRHLETLKDLTTQQIATCRSLNKFIELKDKPATHKLRTKKHSLSTYHIRRSSAGAYVGSYTKPGETVGHDQERAELKTPSQNLPRRVHSIKLSSSKEARETHEFEAKMLETKGKKSFLQDLPIKDLNKAPTRHKASWADSCMKIKKLNTPHGCFGRTQELKGCPGATQASLL